MNQNTFAGKVLLATGATTDPGIGISLVREFIENGCRDIILVARTQDVLDNTRSELLLRYSHMTLSVKTIVMDLGTDKAAEKVYEQAKHLLNTKAVDIVVNNAGFALGGAVTEYDEVEAMNMIMVHIVNLFSMNRLFAKDMAERGWGRIVNTASVAGFTAVPYNTLYAATKAFIIQLSIGLSYEMWKKGVDVVCTALCPGATRSRMMERAKLTDTVIFNELGFMVMEPESVAKAAIRAVRRKKWFVIPGIRNRLLELLTRLLPRTWVTWVGEFFLADRKPKV